MPQTTTDEITDAITAAFTRFAGRAPREGDLYRDPPEKVLDEHTGNLVAVIRCWTYEAGRWEGFIAVHRGATWAL